MATEKQKLAAEKIMDNHGNVSKTMLEVGYTEATSKNPKNLTESDGWKELMGSVLSDEKLLEKHNELLNATDIEHMIFPVAVTDEEITELLTSVNCKPRKFMHGDTANHVWFWSADNKSRKDALDMAYKLKGKYAGDKVEHSGTLSLTQKYKEQ